MNNRFNAFLLFFFIVPSFLVFSQVELLNTSTQSFTNTASSYSTSFQSSFAGRNRILLVAVSIEDGGTDNVNSIVYGGRTLTSINSRTFSASGSSNTAALFYLNENELRQRTTDIIVINTSGNVSNLVATFSVLKNVDQTTPVSNARNNGSTSATVTTGSITSNTNDLIVAVVSNNSGSTAVSSSNMSSVNITTESGGSSISHGFFQFLKTNNAAYTPSFSTPGVRTALVATRVRYSGSTSGALANAGPANVFSDLQLWLKANSSVYSNRVNATAGTTVSVSGGSVYSWKDLSGARTNDLTTFNNSATESTTAPLWYNNAANNLNFNPVVDFSGSEKCVLDLYDDYIFSDKNGITVFAVVRPDINTDNRKFIFDEGFFAENGYGLMYGNTEYGYYSSDFGTLGGRRDLDIAHSNGTTPQIVQLNIGFNDAQSFSLNGKSIRSFPITLKKLTEVEISEGNTHQALTGPFTIGGPAKDQVATRSFDGAIAEFALFNNTISAINTQKINSYLALKYGISLDQSSPTNYLASNGTTKIWNKDVVGANVYNNQIFGIGRDDVSNLNQKQSKSSSGNDIVSIGLGQIATINTANATNFSSNLHFLMCANNNGALANQKTEVDKSKMIYERLTREWQVQETNGDVGLIDIKLDVSGAIFAGKVSSDFRLMLDDDGDFSSGVTIVFPSSVFGTPGTSGAFIYFDDLNLPNLKYFTFCTSPIVPGGISNGLEFWLRAESGFNDVSGKEVAMTINGNTNITVPEKNYNSSMKFDGDFDFISTSMTLNPSLSSMSLFTLTNAITNISSAQTVFQQANGSGPGRSFLYYDTNGKLISFIGGTGTVGTNAVGFEKYNLNTFLFNSNGIASILNIYNEGTLDKVSAALPVESCSGNWLIGTNKTLNSNFFSGNIPEFILYSQFLNTSSRIRIESYLSAKYGLNYPHDLLDSDGNTYWNYANETDVLVIGRDDRTGLYQKQSKSQGDSLKIFVSTLKNTNDLNTGSFTNDKSFLVASYTDGSQKLIGDKNPAYKAAGLYSMLNRIWKIKNVNFDDTFSIEVEWDSTGNLDLNDLRLVVDTDQDLTNGILYDATSGITFSKGSIIISGISTSIIPKNSTRFISIGSVNVATPLPIEMYGFDAKLIQKGKVRLNWVTTTQTNNDYFTVEKSKDSRTWESVEQIKGAGTTTVKISYTSYDENLFYPLTYYRIKQTDFDGTFTYSDVKVVDTKRMAELEISLYPNPTDGSSINIDLSNKELSLVSSTLIDITGKVLMIKAFNLEEKEYTVAIDDNLVDGIYFLKLTLDNGIEKNLKFVICKR